MPDSAAAMSFSTKLFFGGGGDNDSFACFLGYRSLTMAKRGFEAPPLKILYSVILTQSGGGHQACSCQHPHLWLRRDYYVEPHERANAAKGQSSKTLEVLISPHISFTRSDLRSSLHQVAGFGVLPSALSESPLIRMESVSSSGPHLSICSSPKEKKNGPEATWTQSYRCV